LVACDGDVATHLHVEMAAEPRAGERAYEQIDDRLGALMIRGHTGANQSERKIAGIDLFESF
jgi:hypothetical protein